MTKSAGGNKSKRFKKAPAPVTKISASALALITPDDKQTFAAVVTAECGDCKFMVRSLQDEEYKVGLPGSLRKGKRIKINEMVYIELSTLMKNLNGHILHVYSELELSSLEIDPMNVAETAAEKCSDILFTNDSDDSDTEIDFDVI